MSTPLIVPEVGESITEVQIGRWLKAEGDAVEKDEPIVEIETDKITLELPAPEAGTLGPITHPEGTEASVGDQIGTLGAGGGAVGSGGGQAADPDADAGAASSSGTGTKTQSSPASVEKPGYGSRDNGASPDPATGSGEPAAVMPAARRLLSEHGLDAADVPASGPGGRLLKEDVQRFVDGGGTAAAKPTPAAQASASGKAAAEPAAASAGDREDTVPMTPLRKRIAANLVEAQQTAALLTTFNECDMTTVMELRGQYKDAFEKKHGIKLGFMSFFVKAAIDALKAFPAVNAEIRGTDLIYKNHYDIGIAIGGGKGLVVPVLRDADRLSFSEVEQSIMDYAVAAKANKLKLEDLTGGTFTITNGGVYGSLLSTPIVNPPQSGVLGMHGIVRRPIAVGTPGKDERVEVRPMMYVALTYDHRIVDGREAVTFLRRIKEGIEDPTRLLMEV